MRRDNTWDFNKQYNEEWKHRTYAEKQAAKALRHTVQTAEHHNRVFAAEVYNEDRLKRELEERAKTAPALVSLFNSSRPHIGAILNADLGAVAAPEGIVLAASSRQRFFFRMHGQVPQWSDPRLRHPRYQHQCDSFTEARKVACNRLLDPHLMSVDCPRSADLYRTFHQLIAEYRLAPG